mmetsp:Transcript_5738/g.10877  ORF Transcript_5738/g.10877 Transcript_5738/m.10877 type:complete len:217 (-) Transcript_5738:840-1490(-)
MQSIKELSISLFPPSHPIIVLELGNFSPWLDLLSKVALHQRTEVINSKGVNQILHSGIGTNITVSMVTLTGKNTLHQFHHILFWYIPKVISNTRKSTFLIVSSSHSTSHHYVETLQLPLIIGNDNTSNIIGVDINRIISWDSHTNLELTRQIPISIKRFHRIGKDNTPLAIINHGLIHIVLRHILGPILHRCSLLPIQPNFRKRRCHGTKQLCKNL